MADDIELLRAYYEREAELGQRGALSDRRVEIRGRFIAMLMAEDRTSVLDVGAGPAQDGAGFDAADVGYLAIDLAHENGRRALASGFDFVQASAPALPLQADSFEAGWSMSTLMHLDDITASAAIAEITRALAPGSPCLLAQWGHEREERVVSDYQSIGRSRPFHLRSFDHNRALVQSYGEIESEECWTAASADWDYHVFWLRMDDA